MGLDLTLSPITLSGTPWLAYDRLRLSRNYELFDAIKALPSNELPPDTTVEWYEDNGIERQTADMYGEPLRYIQAGEFRNLVFDCRKTEQWNVAVIRFLQELPRETPVVLWWH